MDLGLRQANAAGGRRQGVWAARTLEFMDRSLPSPHRTARRYVQMVNGLR
jgi:hypothetical protein